MYIDAGTGSMLLQIAAAMFFSIVIFFRQIVSGIRKLFGRNGADDEHTDK